MIEIGYSGEFVRIFKKLSPPLQQEIQEKIELFRDVKNHRQLHVHKLHGEHTGTSSFSVNYRYRVIFEYLDKKKQSAALVTVGDHSIYE
jgi:mRNA-degrading endonuclease YafQ of YafQ-DinJ toxin-antitoxin module